MGFRAAVSTKVEEKDKVFAFRRRETLSQTLAAGKFDVPMSCRTIESHPDFLTLKRPTQEVLQASKGSIQ
jgi:hypothetical protein